MNNKRYILISVFLSLLITAGCVFAVTPQEIEQMREAMPSRPAVQPETSRTVLVFNLSNGFKHDCIPYWAKALDIMSEKTGAFSVVHSTDMNVFTPDSLRPFDVICFNNTTKLEPTPEQQTAIMDFITGGKGIVGIHAATDNFDKWPEGAMMMGGTFKGHPWTADGTWAIKIDDPDHPLTKPFVGKGFKIKDEIYRTLGPEYSRAHQRVLMSLDMSDPATAQAKGVTPEDSDTGISWVKPVGKGRLFYCSLGHNVHLTWDKAVLGHYLAGIQYAAGDLHVDDNPVAAAIPTEKLASLIDRLADYDWDSRRAVPIEIEKEIRALDDHKAARIAIERMLLGVLATDTTAAAKDFVCRQLAIIGTEASVPALSQLLADPDTTNMARYALEHIPGDAVDERLATTAETAQDDVVTIGIITTLGARESNRLISLGKAVLAESSESRPDVQTAMIEALGRLGTKESADLLLHIPPALQGQARLQALNALLACAEHLSRTGQNAQAKAIYETLYRTENPSLIRGSALLGLARLGAADADRLSEAVNGSDEIVRTAAIRSLTHINDDAVVSSVTSAGEKLPDIGQIQLLTVLSEHAPEKGRTLAMKLIGSEAAAVRIAAYRALGRSGDASALDLLATAAARADNRDERREAQESLYRLSGTGIDPAILQTIADSVNNGPEDAVVIELINAAAARGIENAVTVLTTTAVSNNRRISNASVQAIQSLAEARHAPELIDLVIAKPGSNTENALMVLGEKISDTEPLASMLRNRYAALGDNVDAKASLLRVMGKLGDPDTVSLIQTEYTSSNEILSQAAFRAMTDWPKADFLDTMKTLSQSAEDERTKILAYRAYLRMLQDAGGPGKETVDALIAAYSLAPRSEERKTVIGAMADYPHIPALNFVREKLADPDLQAEAQVSLLKISESLLTAEPALVKPVLQILKDTGLSESVRNKAGELLNKIKHR